MKRFAEFKLRSFVAYCNTQILISMSSSVLIVFCSFHHIVSLMFVEFIKFIFRDRTSFIEILFEIVYYDSFFELLYYNSFFEFRYNNFLLKFNYYDLWFYDCVMYVKSWSKKTTLFTYKSRDLIMKNFVNCNCTIMSW